MLIGASSWPPSSSSNRASPEPIVPLSLFRIRSFSVSVTAVFLAAFGFFATVVFLPRWFQIVIGSSATESGYQILPLLGGLIISAVTSGQIVSPHGPLPLARLRRARH